MTIAIVSTNKNQYSETFIHNHVKLLPATIHFLFDGYLPAQYSTDKGLTSHFFLEAEKKSRFLWKSKRQSGNREQLNTAIEQYLIKNKIELIFCEYGPSGVEMMELSKKLNIPLAVHFHGYDAYRQDVLSAYGKRYPELFALASAVIGVSKHMCAQLEALGCSPLKLNCLPCGIDENIFYRRETPEKKEITFISCGRFVAKKAPLITIKAFAQVVKQLPEASLMMIGDGELLEDSRKLVSELSLNASVTFTGMLSQQGIVELYSRALIFVQHSITTDDHDSEGTPLTVMEGGASGLPVIATQHGGIADVITDGETGYLVREQDVEGMAEKMLFLAQRPELATRMGAAAAQHMRAKHSLGMYTQRLWSTLQQSVENSKRKS